MSDIVRESVASYGATLRPTTVDEFYRMAEKGIYRDDEKLELLWGEVVTVSPQRSRHAWASENASEILREVFLAAVVRTGSPLRLDETNEPEPDVLVAIGPRPRYLDRHPSAEDALLVVEVADTSVRKDRDLKTRLYAHFGIREYWIINLKSNRLEVFRDPATNGKDEYTKSFVLDKGDIVTPLSAPGVHISVAGLLPE